MNGKYRLFYTLLGVANTSVLSGAFGKATDYADGYLQFILDHIGPKSLVTGGVLYLVVAPRRVPFDLHIHPPQNRMEDKQ